MERIELINKGADAVRNTPHLFNAYKAFLIEDWGRIPEGCFGCQFSSHFNKWKNQVLNKNIIPMEINKTKQDKTYVLRDRGTLKYFKGEVWSNNSSDQDWLEYLQEKPDAKDLFYVLPEVIEKTDNDLVIEEDYKKKDLSDLQPTEDVVVNEVKEDLIDEVNITNETTEDLSDLQPTEKPKRGRRKA